MQVQNVGNGNNVLKGLTDLKKDNQKTNALNINFKQTKKDDIKESLQNQIMNIQKRMGEISDSTTLSLEQKKQLKEELQEELKNLNKQIIEREMQIRKESQEKQEKEMKEKLEKNNPKTEQEQTTSDIFMFSNTLTQIRVENSVRTRMKGQARVLASEIKQDEMYGSDTTKKKEQLAQLNERIGKMDKHIGEHMKDINEKIKKNNKKETEKDVDKEEKVKSDDKQAENKEKSEKHIDKKI
ncbi:FlxA-like family protein [Criibacterium bergeronii]|uniref:Uncharacterized protein n=1 Tax=Criibacterium bergeronii TaxID=1871336 RepID=A0A371INR7_9FIRM|nr:FlxA-like family protein [Criibacterium bergeronii]MBS6062500.1 FlxA-like family protein [Peptostreptococcaceae bacterium]RDY22132.1 hypothetical protein BBG48_001950 [Criibacterium bergeronii]